MNKRLIFLLVLVGLLVIVSVSVVAAQSILPVASIKATDPIAKEPSDPGEFTVYRTNSGSIAPVTIYYKVTGTATNGVDYVKLTGSVVIPGGAASAVIPVKVIDDKIVEKPETVIVTLVSICPSTCAYSVDAAAPTATVTIYDND